MSTTSVLLASGSSLQVAAANPGRAKLTLVNDSDKTIYLSEGGTAEIGKGIRLNANGGVYEVKRQTPRERIFTGQINGIPESGINKRVSISELNQDEI